MKFRLGVSPVFLLTSSSKAFMSPPSLMHTSTSTLSIPSRHHDRSKRMEPFRGKSRMNMMMDPFHIHDFFQTVVLPTSLLAMDAADTVVAAATTASASSNGAVVDTAISSTAAFVSDAMNAATEAVATPDAAAATTTDDNGGFGFLTAPIQGLLSIFHSILVSLGMSANTWGVSIIAMTLFIKILTYPLTKSQLESTTKMQVRFQSTEEKKREEPNQCLYV